MKSGNPFQLISLSRKFFKRETRTGELTPSNSIGSCVDEAPRAKVTSQMGCDPPANSRELTPSSYLFPFGADARQALKTLRESQTLALDTETWRDKSDPFASQTLCLVQLRGMEMHHVPILIARDGFKDLVESGIFSDGKKFIIQNAVFEITVLRQAFGISLPPAKIFDTFIASSLLTNTAYTLEERRHQKRDYRPNSLESLARRVLGVVLEKDHQDSDWSVNLRAPECESMRIYAANDVRYLHRLYFALRSQLDLAKLWGVYELERDLLPCISRMNSEGIPCDLKALGRLYAKAVEETVQAEAKAIEVIGRPINIRSRTKQLLPALQELGITYQGAELPATNKKILPLVDQPEHPAIKAILDWSQVNEEAKQLKQWLSKTDRQTEYSYPEANQFGTLTHRFSYKSPNLQQLKKSAVRQIIVAPKGMKILRADFEQIELVVAAVYHKESKVLEAIHRGVDLHVLMALKFFKSGKKRSPRSSATALES
jgi:DNA polymerase I-like protein with 3'-5' exonuclease and polymerase domains